MQSTQLDATRNLTRITPCWDFGQAVGDRRIGRSARWTSRRPMPLTAGAVQLRVGWVVGWRSGNQHSPSLPVHTYTCPRKLTTS
jgi:hypothetical protein